MVSSRLGVCLVLLCAIASVAAAGADLPLVDAAKQQDAPAVAALLKRGADVNARQPDGATALHWAARWDDLPTAKLLIAAGARVDTANDYGVTPLSLACVNGGAAIVALLLEAGANPNQALPTGETPLMTAAYTGSVETVNALLRRGSQVNVTERVRGQSALMWAVSERHPDVARLLLAHGAEVRARSTSGFTPLLFAARTGDLKIVRLLIPAGADVNDAASDGSTALLVATVRGHVALAAFLLDHGADPNADAAGYTALHWAAGNWDTQLTGPSGIMMDSGEWQSLNGLRGDAKLELVKALLAHGADPNARLKRAPPRVGFSGAQISLTGATPFALAAMGGLDVLRVLLAAGADAQLTTSGLATPLMLAAGLGRGVGESRLSEAHVLEVVRFLVGLGHDVNARDDEGDTALFGASAWGMNSVVQFLVDQGATVDVTDKVGATPLLIAEGKFRIAAANTAHPETAALLRKLGGEGIKH